MRPIVMGAMGVFFILTVLYTLVRPRTQTAQVDVTIIESGMVADRIIASAPPDQLIFCIFIEGNSKEWQQFEKIIGEYQKKNKDVKFLLMPGEIKEFEQIVQMSKATGKYPLAMAFQGLHEIAVIPGMPNNVEEFTKAITAIKQRAAMMELRIMLEDAPKAKPRLPRKSTNKYRPREALYSLEHAV